MTKHGGEREGAGRPKGSMSVKAKLRLKMQEEFIEFINKHKKEIWEAHLKLGLGVFVPVINPLTKEIVGVAQRPPDGYSLSWMQEQVWGRAPQELRVEADVKTQIDSDLPAEAWAAIENAIDHALPPNRRQPRGSRNPQKKAKA